MAGIPRTIGGSGTILVDGEPVNGIVSWSADVRWRDEPTPFGTLPDVLTLGITLSNVKWSGIRFVKSRKWFRRRNKWIFTSGG